MKVKFKTWEQLLKVPGAENKGDRIYVGGQWISRDHLKNHPDEFEVINDFWDSEYEWVARNWSVCVSRWMIVEKEDNFDRLYLILKG